MTSAGGNFTYFSHGKNKLNYHPLILKIFADFSFENCGSFTRYSKDDKTVYNNFFGKLKILLHLGFPL